MYVAVKGGERAIENSHKLVAEERRGDPGFGGVAEAEVNVPSGSIIVYK